MKIYSHFLYTWKTKKKFLTDAHAKTVDRIYWIPPQMAEFIALPAGWISNRQNIRAESYHSVPVYEKVIVSYVHCNSRLTML